MNDSKVRASDLFSTHTKAPKTPHSGVAVAVAVAALAVISCVIWISFPKRGATPDAASIDIDRFGEILPSQMGAEELETTHAKLKDALNSPGVRQDTLQKLIDRIENEKAYRARNTFKARVESALKAEKIDEAIEAIRVHLNDKDAAEDHEQVRVMLTEIQASRSDETVRLWLQSLSARDFQSIPGIVRPFATPAIAEYFFKQVARNLPQAAEQRKKSGLSPAPVLAGGFSFSRPRTGAATSSLPAIQGKNSAETSGKSPAEPSRTAVDQNRELQIRQLAQLYRVSNADARRVFEIIDRMDRGEELSASDRTFLERLEQSLSSR